MWGEGTFRLIVATSEGAIYILPTNNAHTMNLEPEDPTKKKKIEQRKLWYCFRSKRSMNSDGNPLEAGHLKDEGEMDLSSEIKFQRKYINCIWQNWVCWWSWAATQQLNVKIMIASETSEQLEAYFWSNDHIGCLDYRVWSDSTIQWRLRMNQRNSRRSNHHLYSTWMIQNN